MDCSRTPMREPDREMKTSNIPFEGGRKQRRAEERADAKKLRKENDALRLENARLRALFAT